MTKAISIHIGLNNVDPNAYNGWNQELFGCINDANAMQRIADSLGFLSIPILNEEATADRVISEIGQAAINLDPGGILLLTYSGHGGQVPDANGDEEDGKDETWVLFDRQLIDDELVNLWDQFGAGARILVISDSCHSGTITRDKEYQTFSQILNCKYRGPRGNPPRFRGIPAQVAANNYQQNRSKYRALQFASGSHKRSLMSASVLLISGCQDNQLSSDGDVNGLFTENLLSVWRNGAFNGNYRAFYQAILDLMPSTQTPNYNGIGAANPGFEAQRPFTPAAPSSGGQGSGNGQTQVKWPSISGPGSASRFSPPTFSVNPGPGRFYAVELATDANLFNDTAGRTDDNFYGSWSDTALMNSSSYRVPSYVWNRLSEVDRLYYRIDVSTDSSTWADYQVSNDGDAPSLNID